MMINPATRATVSQRESRRSLQHTAPQLPRRVLYFFLSLRKAAKEEAQRKLPHREG